MLGDHHHRLDKTPSLLPFFPSSLPLPPLLPHRLFHRFKAEILGKLLVPLCKLHESLPKNCRLEKAQQAFHICFPNHAMWIRVVFVIAHESAMLNPDKRVAYQYCTLIKMQGMKTKVCPNVNVTPWGLPVEYGVTEA